MRPISTCALAFALVGVSNPLIFVCAEERTESFDEDPQWDARNNRAVTPEPQLVTQQFGYSTTKHAAGAAGEIGGMLTPAAEPAYYARPIELRSFEDELVASGRFAATGRHFHVLVGFFNAGTVNEWRTPNSIVLRLYGRGEVFFAYVEYATSRWRAGADSPGGFSTVIERETGKPHLKGFAIGTPHTWSLRYEPKAGGGTGSVIATIDDEMAVCHLDPGAQARWRDLQSVRHPQYPQAFRSGRRSVAR